MRWPSSSTPSTVGGGVGLERVAHLQMDDSRKRHEGPTSVHGPQTGEVLPVVDIEPR